jgi:exodeoxyribonuclease VII small subunit
MNLSTRAGEDTLKCRFRERATSTWRRCDLLKGSKLVKKSSIDIPVGEVLPAASPTVDPVTLPFEQALTELERIVLQMENGSLTLEQSLASYKRGVSLVASCRDSLNSARQQVKILEGDLMKPFDVERED